MVSVYAHVGDILITGDNASIRIGIEDLAQ